MTVVVLFLILTGSFGTAITLYFYGVSWGAVLLGYVAGGWIGLLAGLPLLLGLRWLIRKIASLRHRLSLQR